MLDVTHLIDPTDRQVGTRTLEGGTARVLTVTRTYPTDAADLWSAVTDPQRIPRWFLPVSGELHVGGRYQLEGNAGGEITTCDPPHRFTATWEFADQISWIEVDVVPDGDDAARLQLTHIAHVADEMWDEYGPGAAGVGWDGALMGLANHLQEGPGGTGIEGAEEWMASDEGRAFYAASSAAWADAAVAAGEDPQAMAAASERTTAFYTGG